ncbi:hypothetical protein PL79_007275 [Burkholderia sp. USMB20]|nr:hypothetical protein PL79_007275 [Burkholderia sp. USMB20]
MSSNTARRSQNSISDQTFSFCSRRTIYRPLSALREAGKALGVDPAIVDRAAKQHRWFDSRQACCGASSRPASPTKMRTGPAPAPMPCAQAANAVRRMPATRHCPRRPSSGSCAA